MLSKTTLNILEKHDIKIYERDEQRGEFYREIEFFSDGGEDCVETIWYDGTNKNFIESFGANAENFDPDDHAEIWVDSRGKNGVPATIRELLDDADSIKTFLLTVAQELSESLNK